MSTTHDIGSQEVDRRLFQIREAAGIKQAELAPEGNVESGGAVPRGIG